MEYEGSVSLTVEPTRLAQVRELEHGRVELCERMDDGRGGVHALRGRKLDLRERFVGECESTVVELAYECGDCLRRAALECAAHRIASELARNAGWELSVDERGEPVVCRRRCRGRFFAVDGPANMIEVRRIDLVHEWMTLALESEAGRG